MGQCGARNREIGVIQEQRGRGGRAEGKEEREPMRRGTAGERRVRTTMKQYGIMTNQSSSMFFTSCQLGHQAIRTLRLFSLTDFPVQ